MKEVVNLYSKLVIGTFSFMGPAFTLLTSLFYKAVEVSKQKHAARISILREVIKKELDGESNSKKLKDSVKELRQLERRNAKEQNLLKPRRQAKRLFISLIMCIVFIGFYYFQCSELWPNKYLWIICLSLFLSIAFYIFALIVLWQIFCSIIQAKKDEQNVTTTTKPLDQNEKIIRFIIQPRPSETLKDKK